MLCLLTTVYFARQTPGSTNRKSTNLRKDFDLTDKGDLSSFLGVSIQRDPAGSFTFTQEGLINKILSDTNLQSCSPNHTPAAPVALGSDPNGAPFKESWHYSSIVGMLLFLANTAAPTLPLLPTNAPALPTTPNNHMQPQSKQSSGISKELQHRDLFSSRNPIWRSTVSWTQTSPAFGTPNPMMIPSPSRAVPDM